MLRLSHSVKYLQCHASILTAIDISLRLNLELWKNDDPRHPLSSSNYPQWRALAYPTSRARQREELLAPARGRRQAGETPEQCLAREVLEETGLTIRVERLLLDDPAPSGDVYQCLYTYLCRPSTLMASLGMEPEPEAAALYTIVAVGWYPLADETKWDTQIIADPPTAPLLRRIRIALGDVASAGR